MHFFLSFSFSWSSQHQQQPGELVVEWKKEESWSQITQSLNVVRTCVLQDKGSQPHRRIDTQKERNLHPDSIK